MKKPAKSGGLTNLVFLGKSRAAHPSRHREMVMSMMAMAAEPHEASV
jgi:hypothetical protein